jgi:hypothetical protein
MISLIFQGFLILLFAFLIGLPIGDLLARQLRRWLKRPRMETDRMLVMVAPSTPASPPLAPPDLPLTYPVSVFGHSSVSTPVRRDGDTPTPPPAPLISASLPPPAR